MHLGIGALTGLALASHSALADQPLMVWESGTPASSIRRVWYGDGEVYAGPTVPGNIKTAFNVTVDEARSELLYVKPDTEASPSSAAALENPTFLVIDVRPGASGPARFLHSAVGLTHEDIYLFSSMGGYWYPHARSSVPGSLFLVPTGVEGAYGLRWFVNPGEAVSVGGVAATLPTGH